MATDVEERVAVLEANIGFLREEMSEVRKDIRDMRTELKGDIIVVRSELKGDISSLRSELRGDVSSLRVQHERDFRLFLAPSLLSL